MIDLEWLIGLIKVSISIHVFISDEELDLMKKIRLFDRFVIYSEDKNSTFTRYILLYEEFH